ncbi:Eukaryotic translation initiation factor 3 subunit B [Coccomyxa sp. Obi]|nr:Eukaryotic translation initiation factor 3 subunit B [Coccomyxa sp. Obi]
MATAMLLRPEEERMFEGQPKGFPFEGFHMEDVMLPEDDDMDIPSDDDEDDEEEIQTETGFGSVVVVDNLPIVPEEKFEKLSGVVKKVISQAHGIIREGGFYMPKDEETKNTKGYAFVEFNSPEEALAVRQAVNGFKLDKNHTFAVNLFDEIDRYMRVPDEYEPPEDKTFQPTENLWTWMMDRRGRDQFVIRYGDETEVHWNDAQRAQAEEVYKRSFWTESFVVWSPHGSYLATVHRQGVAIWGGPSFSRLHRFSHPNVRLVEFSPDEKCILSYSSREPSNPNEKAGLLVNVYDCSTGQKLRTFEGSIEDYAVGSAATADGSLKWPIFKWAANTFIARLGKGSISVYELPDMVLLDKKSLKLEGVQDFAWSPSQPVLCAYQTEQAGGNLPARISLISFPEKRELRQKNLFSVSDVRLFWHPQGDYLAVQVDRFTKTRKSTFTAFELFSVKERDIPMEVLELPNRNDKIVDFQWEPRGSRFAVLHGEGPRPNLSLYAMRDMKTSARGVQHITTQPGKQANCIHWSPQGKFLVLGGLKAMNGQLEFFSADDAEVLNAAEHFMCTNIEWDPTGRYVATSVTSIHQMENGFNIWLFNGTLLYRSLKDQFFQFSWRPRAPTLLSKEQEADVVKRLKEFSKRYDEEDSKILEETDVAIVAERQRMMEEWREWYDTKREWLEWHTAGLQRLLGDRLLEGDYTVEEVETETTVSTVEEVLKS